MSNGDELEEIRKRKLEQLKQSQEDQVQKAQQIDQAKSQIESALRPLLTQDAWDQWNSAKIGNENNAYSTGLAIIKSSQTGQLQGKITKEQIRDALSAVSKQTRTEWNIKRK